MTSSEQAHRQDFNYDEAFSRNVGWVTEAEQAALRGKRVAVAGLGGVGGVHVLTLARLGVGAFNIADFDTFSLANFNRQAGAMVSTVGRTKIDVITEMAKDINPEIDIRQFRQGVSQENLDEFLSVEPHFSWRFTKEKIYVDDIIFKQLRGKMHEHLKL